MDDYISRQAAILQIQRHGVGCFDADEFSPERAERFVINLINELPGVLQAKTGHWMNSDIPESMLSKCSVCGWDLGAYTHKFCANCGTRMIKDGETIAEYIDKHVKDIPYKGVEPWEGR